MRPIDIIKHQVYDDVQRPKVFIMCEIIGVVSIKGVGIVLKVIPLEEDDKPLVSVDNSGDLETPAPKSEDTKLESFNVACINRPPFWNERGIKEKYYACVLGLVKDSPSNSLALLVPKTLIDSLDDLGEWGLDRMLSKKKTNVFSKGSAP